MKTFSGFKFFKLREAVFTKFAAVCIAISLSGCTSWQSTGKVKDPSASETVDPKLFQAERFGEEKSIPIDAGYFIYK